MRVCVCMHDLFAIICINKGGLRICEGGNGREEWEEISGINVTAVLVCCQATVYCKCMEAQSVIFDCIYSTNFIYTSKYSVVHTDSLQ